MPGCDMITIWLLELHRDMVGLITTGLALVLAASVNNWSRSQISSHIQVSGANILDHSLRGAAILSTGGCPGVFDRGFDLRLFGWLRLIGIGIRPVYRNVCLTMASLSGRTYQLTFISRLVWLELIARWGSGW